jgi:hypothetical protein
MTIAYPDLLLRGGRFVGARDCKSGPGEFARKCRRRRSCDSFRNRPYGQPILSCPKENEGMSEGLISKTAAPDRLLDDAVSWAAFVPPDGYPAYAFAKRALQAATMAAIDAAARLDRDWLSRVMSDPASLRAHARRYRELKGREINWALPGEPL